MPSPISTIPFNDLSRTPRPVMAEIEAAVARVLASGWFVMGPEHAGFEAELSEYLGGPEVVLVGNGTDALEIALAAVGVGAGDRVLTVANAGAYATIAARLLGADAVYCDVSPISLLMTPETFSATLDGLAEPPKAVVVTHLFGAMAEVEQIAAIAKSHGIAVVEDCAQALGARHSGRMAGMFGDIATTSFYPTKNLGALGDGGAIYTRDPALADRARRMRQYGWESKYHIAYDHGRNSRLDELQAAILRVKLPHLDAWNQRRRAIHARYAEASSPAARVVHTGSESFIAHLAVLTAENRDDVRAALTAAGVSTDVHYPVPDHHQAFPSRPPEPLTLEATEWSVGAVFSVPMFPELSDAEVDQVASALAGLDRAHG